MESYIHDELPPPKWLRTQPVMPEAMPPPCPSLRPDRLLSGVGGLPE